MGEDKDYGWGKHNIRTSVYQLMLRLLKKRWFKGGLLGKTWGICYCAST